MNQKFILAFILLVNFSVTNATKFFPCDHEDLPVPTVRFDPDPLGIDENTAFTVSGTTGAFNFDIYKVLISLVDKNAQEIDEVFYDVDPPIKAGSSFSFELAYKLEKSLPPLYFIFVGLYEHVNGASVLNGCAEGYSLIQ
ncbi:hypothetical protein C2G38_2061589 [Gigaspora rosea]|uniref:MD-2-related lipid-recognition domain-containing protein n=1 Tax=Gigaspora rosea TaxID=44941 RepID=A0A397W2S7_9GLOM|nr:hypothetical protein C2G38_2061589 [Gigaspora rosea]CAG8536086.1 4369_t:CDS:1 [Gigaspora rosea]